MEECASCERSACVGGARQQVHEDGLEKVYFPAPGEAAKFLQQHPALLSTLTASQKADEASPGNSEVLELAVLGRRRARRAQRGGGFVDSSSSNCANA